VLYHPHQRHQPHKFHFLLSKSMRFNDILEAEDEIETEIDPEVAFYGDMRRKRLTLEHVNRLRKLRDLRKYEEAQRLDLVKKMYARPAPV